MAKQKPVENRPPAPVVPEVVPADKSVKFDITPPEEEVTAGLALRRAADLMVIVDKASHHGALEAIRDGKRLKRAIEDHWSRITRRLDDMKRDFLDMKKRDLEPVETGLATLSRIAMAYEDAENRRIRDEEERRRREVEEQARRDREQQLADQEAQALKLEADSPNLSNREQIFVEAIGLHEVGVSNEIATDAAKRAGFKNPLETAQRLLATPKIMDAIAAKRVARQLRQQQEALRSQALDVKEPERVERTTARVSGVRRTVHYSAAVDALDKLIDAVLEGKAPRAALKADEVYLNDQARQLKVAFPAAFPGCRLVQKDGIAG